MGRGGTFSLKYPIRRDCMKCGYSHCLFNCEVDKENAVKLGTRYYHKECLKQRNEKDEIRKLYLEQVNATEVVSVLNSVINNIVHIKKVDSGFLLYALKHAIQNKFVFHNPAGLHYIINNSYIKKQYQQYINKSQIKDFKNNIENIDTEKDVEFTYNQEQRTLWDRITQQ
jgi:hypothetical protein